MSLIPVRCVKYHDARKTCTVSEKGKTYTLLNESGFKVKLVAVDKCIIREEGNKSCDFLLNIDEKQVKRAIFIELKGGDLAHALQQVYDSLIYLKDEFKSHQFDARIVGTRDVPGYINIPTYKRLDKVLRSTGGTLKRATNKMYTETI